MKITNFRLTERKGTSATSWKFKAVVSVETGLFFKKKENKVIYKEYGEPWVFVDTGKYTPNYQTEALQRKFEAEKMETIELCAI